MDKKFLESLEKPLNYVTIFDKLYHGVTETNKLIGIGLDDLDDQQREDLIETYGKLRDEEIKEVQEAIANKDRDNLVKELLDVLIVVGYEYYLRKKCVFYTNTKPSFNIGEDFKWLFSLNAGFASIIHLEMILRITQNLLQGMNINLEDAVHEVLDENLSKFPTLEELNEIVIQPDIIQWQCTQLESERYQGVHCKEVVDSKGETRLTFWCTHEYGKDKLKYLKPISYQKCNLNNIWLD